MLGLTFRQLQVFVEVVDLGSFRACADRLGITQVSVSGHIRSMERLVGHALFHRRQGATSELTENGHLLYRYAVPMLEQAHDLMRELGSTEAGRLRRRLIATGPGYVTFRLAGVLAEFGERFPEYQIEIEPNDSYPAADAVARGDADIGFHIGVEGTLPASCEFVGREKIAFYVGRDHPLATRNIVSAEDLSACPLIPLPRKDRLRDVVEAVMARLGVSGNPVALQTANPVLAQRTLLQGKAMACLFAQMAQVEVDLGNLVELPLPETLPMIEVGVVFSRRIAARRAAAELLALSRSGWPVSKSTTQVLLERQ
jgi:DNA-binding transcriptional LysR family regulator